MFGLENWRFFKVRASLWPFQQCSVKCKWCQCSITSTEKWQNLPHQSVFGVKATCLFKGIFVKGKHKWNFTCNRVSGWASTILLYHKLEHLGFGVWDNNMRKKINKITVLAARLFTLKSSLWYCLEPYIISMYKKGLLSKKYTSVS